MTIWFSSLERIYDDDEDDDNTEELWILKSFSRDSRSTIGRYPLRLVEITTRHDFSSIYVMAEGDTPEESCNNAWLYHCIEGIYRCEGYGKSFVFDRRDPLKVYDGWWCRVEVIKQDGSLVETEFMSVDSSHACYAVAISLGEPALISAQTTRDEHFVEFDGKSASWIRKQGY